MSHLGLSITLSLSQSSYTGLSNSSPPFHSTDCSWEENTCGLMSTNSTWSRDEWAQPSRTDYVVLISAYIKASAETESLTTPSVLNFFFLWMFEPEPAVFMCRPNRFSRRKKCDTLVGSSVSAKARWTKTIVLADCGHLSTAAASIWPGGQDPLTHPLLFVFKSVQQRGLQPGRTA